MKRETQVKLSPKNKRSLFFLMVSFLVCTFFSGAVFLFINTKIVKASINQKINYQGKLLNDEGFAVSNSDYNLRFRLCQSSDCSGGSDPLWTETHCYSPDSGATCNGTGTDQRVSVSGGIFNMLLGSVTSLALVDFDQSLYLEVQVGGSGTTPSWETLTPRKEIGSVPSAFNSDKLDSLDSAESGADAHIVKTDSSGDITTSADLNLGADVSLRRGGADRLDLSSGDSLNLVSGSIQMAGTSIVTSNRVLQNITQANIDNIRLDGNTISATNDSGLALYDNASNGIFIQDGGNVGIGTTGPVEKLEVAGDIALSGTINARWSSINRPMLWGSTDGTYIRSTDNSATDGIKFQSYAGGELIRILDSGNIGIGTIAPGARLDIKTSYETSKWAFIVNQSGSAPIAAATHDSILFQRGDVASIKIVDVGDSNALSLASGDGNSTISSVNTLRFFVNGTMTSNPYSGMGGTQAMHINSSGNIGIGTVSPAFAANAKGLDIAGTGGILDNPQDGTERIPTLRITDTVNDYGSGTATANEIRGAIEFYASETSSTLPGVTSAIRDISMDAYNTSHDLAFYTYRNPDLGGSSLTEVMRMTSTGNVGIGSTSPSYALDVNGTGRFTGAVTLDSTLAVTGTISGSNLSGTNTGNQTITLTGDVTGSGTGSFATTIAANSVALATDTTGNYVASITGGSGIASSGATSGENIVHTLSLSTLTANWDAGGYEIRSRTLESDVATGTSPFTIASTTKVTNLNADLLDGHDTSYFQTAGSYDNYVSWTIQDGDTTTYPITSGDTLQIASGAGITSNFTADDVLTITAADTSASNELQNLFSTIAISGQDNVVADANSDTLTFVNGSNVTITTNATGDSVTINSADNNTIYSAGGTLLNLSSTTFSVNEGTLTNGKICTYVSGTGLVCNSDDANTTYSPGNDLDLSGTTFNIESQLDYVSTITRASSNLTLSTTTSGHIILNPAGNVGIGTTAPGGEVACISG